MDEFTHKLETAPCYHEVNKAFLATCKLLFGGQIGELKEFDGYLSGIMDRFRASKSVLTGKEVISNTYYPSDARFVSADETGGLKQPVIGINDLKDIDSLVEAAREMFVYSGNRYFGNNAKLWMADNITDSQYVMNAHNVVKSKYASHSCYTRECSHIFGIVGNPYSQFSMMCSMGGNLMRCLESYSCSNSRDLYYCFMCDDCTDAMFSFGLRGKQYAIGNNVLPRDKYLALKEKLVGEIAEELRGKKKIPQLIELPQYYKFVEKADLEGNPVSFAPCPSSVDEAFGKTTKLILGESLAPIYKYEPWLMGINLFNMRKVLGAFERTAMKHSYGGFDKLHSARLVREQDFFDIAQKTQVGGIDTKLDELRQKLAEKIYFTCALTVMPSTNTVDTPYSLRCNDTYVAIGVEAKYVGYAVAIKSNYIFGGLGRVVESNFDINCYDSVNITRCFEVDGSYNTSDSLFCHNCENVTNGLFSFNVKGKSNVVCNTQVGKDGFLKAKKVVLDYVLERLKQGKDVEGLHLFSVPEWNLKN